MKNIKSEPHKTVLTITLGFTIIYYFTRLEWVLFFGLGIGMVSIFSNYSLNIIVLIWAKLTWVLSLIVPNVLLSLIFFLVLFPIAMLSRLFGNDDPLSLKRQKNSLFKPVNKGFYKSSFEKTW